MFLRLCNYHRTGVPWPDVKAHEFFQSGCYRCEAKKEAGIVKGDEPPPPRHTSFEQALLRHTLTPGRNRVWKCRHCERPRLNQTDTCANCGSQDLGVGLTAKARS